MRFAPLVLMIGIFAGCSARNSNLVSHAPAHFRARPNPVASNTASSQIGAQLYASECAVCHGEKREGGKGPPLANSKIYQAPPGALFWVIRSGSLFNGMPSFADLPPQQRWQIVAFLQRDKSGATNGIAGGAPPRVH